MLEIVIAIIIAYLVLVVFVQPAVVIAAEMLEAPSNWPRKTIGDLEMRTDHARNKFYYRDDSTGIRYYREISKDGKSQYYYYEGKKKVVLDDEYPL